ncbi:MAG TPA: phosphatidylglycerol lysyltransferase domain-containing protein, partial [Bacteroidales bacterium]|nr:phosphatidylglycerol lysyltransferase domain-containing protein [Bacteroidales bacterium]
MKQYLPITLSDQTLIEPYLKNTGKTGAEYSFTTLYMWAGIFNSFYRVVPQDGQSLLLVRSRKDPDAPWHFLYPMGAESSVPAEIALKVLKEAAEDHPFVVGALSREEAIALQNTGAPHLEILETRDSFDYVYQASSLVTLKGKKLQPKRNHLNAFTKDFPDFKVVPITQDEIPACLKMNYQWCQMMGCMYEVDLGQEACAVHKAFRGFRELGLEGLMLLADRQVIAYTLGELFNKNTWLVHVEKAFPQYRGAYQLINREFVRYALEKYPEIEYINREDDSGDEGLRQAKLSYHPAFFIEKYKAVL